MLLLPHKQKYMGNKSAYQKEITFLVVSAPGRYFDDFALFHQFAGGRDEINGTS